LSLQSGLENHKGYKKENKKAIHTGKVKGRTRIPKFQLHNNKSVLK
jgi:hypothetical protein